MDDPIALISPKYFFPEIPITTNKKIIEAIIEFVISSKRFDQSYKANAQIILHNNVGMYLPIYIFLSQTYI